MIENIFLLIAAYLLGSISSAIIVCKIAGLPDPRATGSNNPGATNVLRIGGKKAALFTLFGDALKGFIPVLIARCLQVDNTMLALVLFSAFIGHLYPVFFRFQGGKGVATTIGGLLAFSWQLAACWLVCWLGVAFLTRYSSLSALIATFILPFSAWFFSYNEMTVLIFSLLSILLIYKHRANIKKLCLGQEKKIGQ